MRMLALLVTGLVLVAPCFIRADDAPIKVVTTLTDLKDIADAVGGTLVETHALVAGPQDPHFVDPRPVFLVQLRDADLLIVNGLELEKAWVGPLLDNARNSRIAPGGEGYIDASAGVPVLELPEAGTTRASGDIHPFGNPHYLLDPLNGKIVAHTIAKAIEGLRPGASAAIQKNVKAFDRSIDEAMFGPELVDLVGGAKLTQRTRDGTLDAFLAGTVVDGKPLTDRLGGWLGRMKPLKGRPILTYHRSFTYFANRFGLVVADFVEPLPGIAPSAKHLVDLVGTIKAKEIRVIVTHPFYDSKSPQLLADKTGVRVLMLPSAVGGVSGATHYVDIFEKAVAAITEAHSVAETSAPEK